MYIKNTDGKLIVAFLALVLFVVTFTLSELQGDEFTLTPDGTYVQGTEYTLTPDGTYVSGIDFVMTPDGDYVGTTEEPTEEE